MAELGDATVGEIAETKVFPIFSRNALWLVVNLFSLPAVLLAGMVHRLFFPDRTRLIYGGFVAFMTLVLAVSMYLDYRVTSGLVHGGWVGCRTATQLQPVRGFVVYAQASQRCPTRKDEIP